VNSNLRDVTSGASDDAENDPRGANDTSVADMASQYRLSREEGKPRRASESRTGSRADARESAGGPASVDQDAAASKDPVKFTSDKDPLGPRPSSSACAAASMYQGYALRSKPEVSAYEIQRQQRMQANMEKLQSLGLQHGLAAAVSVPDVPAKRPTKRKSAPHENGHMLPRRVTRSSALQSTPLEKMHHSSCCSSLCRLSGRLQVPLQGRGTCQRQTEVCAPGHQNRHSPSQSPHRGRVQWQHFSCTRKPQGKEGQCHGPCLLRQALMFRASMHCTAK
jgi:hypothetical protein